MKNQGRAKKNHHQNIQIIAITLLLAILFLIYQSFTKPQKIPALFLQNFTSVAISVDGQNILLTADCHRLVMTTSIEQADSIQRVLINASSIRPNAHDLFVQSIGHFNISLLFVKVHSIKEGTYYSTMFLEQGNEILLLDARPSDAIAIALRANSPVYLNKGLLEYAENVC